MDNSILIEQSKSKSKIYCELKNNFEESTEIYDKLLNGISSYMSICAKNMLFQDVESLLKILKELNCAHNDIQEVIESIETYSIEQEVVV